MESTTEAKLRQLLKTAANELCLQCGLYCREHLGACNGCRWLAIKHGDLTHEGIDTTDSEEADK